jgi:nitroimidazol reductase NimA-like FMN-containing flavoprotein (pyridoxamine 5'-phosphate oxidase superfamily)
LVDVKLPSMSRKEVDNLISQQFLCRIAFRGKDSVYIAPFQYVFMKKHLYFHFTDYGNKMLLFREGFQVCVEIEKYSPDLGEYAFVILTGTLKMVVEREERRNVIQKMAEFGSAKLSTNFLCAHGFESQNGWSAFNAEQPILIFKLEEITSIKGLKSPQKRREKY